MVIAKATPMVAAISRSPVSCPFLWPLPFLLIFPLPHLVRERFWNSSIQMGIDPVWWVAAKNSFVVRMPRSYGTLHFTPSPRNSKRALWRVFIAWFRSSPQAIILAIRGS